MNIFRYQNTSIAFDKSYKDTRFLYLFRLYNCERVIIVLFSVNTIFHNLSLNKVFRCCPFLYLDTSIQVIVLIKICKNELVFTYVDFLTVFSVKAWTLTHIIIEVEIVGIEVSLKWYFDFIEILICLIFELLETLD